MPNQDGFRSADLLQEILKGISESGNTDGWQRRRSAIARHVPGSGVKPILEKVQLTPPHPRRAAYSMQEHERRHAGIAGGLIAKTAIFGLHGHQMRHA